MMKEMENINNKINMMRKLLQDLINEKSNLLDPDVILVSQELDEILNEYNKLISKVEK
ncbi:Spo0E family sporulation regulatory protein-aspartic acid phosphatase [Clostridium beijerinckii]|nr:Spo0E family sporulation regulatory protein-aspartic acid phosphatase [Clostridium beijerinckii]MZK62069.1 Spo0E family sporulation regulatory protein-aspartic acid phosphatase [Clostridium beijerinckii]MZK72285.1 Spo0E family sporulation regulatory protein-aspartic acid phosphatase [Clostridium beijerinckii]MZK77680.1 Spo0E family sporulation regulatory protein-aspartic acid phosphatase [Clostridium beijerinckii]MZK87250.1 Spo0E family sporulation regulatory protein-aspartic acid phosphatas